MREKSTIALPSGTGRATPGRVRLSRTVATVAGLLMAVGLTLANPGAAASAATRPVQQDGAPVSTGNHPVDPDVPIHTGGRGRLICLNAYLERAGWQGWQCGRSAVPVQVGTVFRRQQIEAVMVRTWRTGGICLRGHVQNIGWLPPRCGRDGQVVMAGTIGRHLRLEAVQVRMSETRFCARALVERTGWQDLRCSRGRQSVTVGTTGESRQLQALRMTVF